MSATFGIPVFEAVQVFNLFANGHLVSPFGFAVWLLQAQSYTLLVHLCVSTPSVRQMVMMRNQTAGDVQQLSLVHPIVLSESLHAHAVDANVSSMMGWAQRYGIVVTCPLAHAGSFSWVVDLCRRTGRALQIAEHAPDSGHLTKMFFFVFRHGFHRTVI